MRLDNSLPESEKVLIHTDTLLGTDRLVKILMGDDAGRRAGNVDGRNVMAYIISPY